MALIPPSFLDSVVALGMQSQDKKVQFMGTGFMYGHPTGETNDKGPTYWTFLVTNRHVVAKAAERGSTIHARFNRPMGSESHTYPLPLKEPDGSLSWTTHEKADIAVLQMNADMLQADGIHLFESTGMVGQVSPCRYGYDATFEVHHHGVEDLLAQYRGAAGFFDGVDGRVAVLADAD